MHNESKKILFAVLDIIRRKCDLTPQPTQLEIATREEMQKNLKEVGIGLDIRTYEWGTFYNDIKTGNFVLSCRA